jgi:hypothetical protein
MNKTLETHNMAVFSDFENVALGVRDGHYAQFDIKEVLERLLLKGSIVVKKTYCDWECYNEFKAVMHEAAPELIEIPHARQFGKNSSDTLLEEVCDNVLERCKRVSVFAHGCIIVPPRPMSNNAKLKTGQRYLKLLHFREVRTQKEDNGSSL